MRIKNTKNINIIWNSKKNKYYKSFASQKFDPAGFGMLEILLSLSLLSLILLAFSEAQILVLHKIIAIHQKILNLYQPDSLPNNKLFYKNK